MKGVPQSEWNTPTNSAKWQKMYQEMRESPAYKEHTEQYEQAQKEVPPYIDSASVPGRGPDVPHGFVWLFRRK